ncbi:hypothetical protein RFI_29910 [Reticulomyxa filosa]|uniref:Uncharacterized protein n=1 Tax=Reticulomyxa filosa TaxID=46433 RepID=X6M1K9_RETFI|nr:hypothetical protein RFI_29910 [Reticulomyxa filosa]|eukprot:ETO07481.1 hypothetical protein RFI_29910 [Reticulomyxa filosa]
MVFFNRLSTLKKWFFYLDALHPSTKEKENGLQPSVKKKTKKLYVPIQRKISGLKPYPYSIKNEKVNFFILFYFNKKYTCFHGQVLLFFFKKKEKLFYFVNLFIGVQINIGNFFYFYFLCFILLFYLKVGGKEKCREKNGWEKRLGKKIGKKFMGKNGGGKFLFVKKKKMRKLKKK